MCNEAPFTSETLPLKIPKVPTQENGFDCGLFLCKYFEFIVKDVESFASERDVYNPSFNFSWGQNDVTILRWDLVTLITSLHVDYFLEDPHSTDLSKIKEWREIKKAGRKSYTIEGAITIEK